MYPVLFHQTEYILVLLSKDIMKTAEEIMLMCKEPTAIIPRLLWLPNFLRYPLRFLLLTIIKWSFGHRFILKILRMLFVLTKQIQKDIINLRIIYFKVNY